MLEILVEIRHKEQTIVVNKYKTIIYEVIVDGVVRHSGTADDVIRTLGHYLHDDS